MLTIGVTPDSGGWEPACPHQCTNTPQLLCTLTVHYTGAPNDGFLSDPLKCYFRLPGVLLKLCRFILGCATCIIFLPVRSF